MSSVNVQTSLLRPSSLLTHHLSRPRDPSNLHRQLYSRPHLSLYSPYSPSYLCRSVQCSRFGKHPSLNKPALKLPWEVKVRTGATIAPDQNPRKKGYASLSLRCRRNKDAFLNIRPISTPASAYTARSLILSLHSIEPRCFWLRKTPKTPKKDHQVYPSETDS